MFVSKIPCRALDSKPKWFQTQTLCDAIPFILEHDDTLILVAETLGTTYSIDTTESCKGQLKFKMRKGRKWLVGSGT